MSLFIDVSTQGLRTISCYEWSFINEPVYDWKAYVYIFWNRKVQDCINISKVIDYVELSYHVKIFISKWIKIDTFMYIVEWI